MERRLAAILATDVVGYSRLIRADEEGTIVALKALRADLVDPKLDEHHGRIVKLMGDGMLAEFPSVVDAVRAAVETQIAIAEHNADLPKDKRIEFRVGINLGDVVIDGDDIHGDGVNVAARLEGIAEPGGICISGKVYEEVRDRVDVLFEDLGEQEVKNIARPIHVWRWSKCSDLEIVRPATTSSGEDVQSSVQAKPSIAVLPFDNLSGDTEQEYFADGMTEDIITGLSKFHWLFVIARNSSFAYKGRSPDVRDVARDLGVRYVLEGSVRRGGSRIRITAQLIDAETGNHIWAERFDRELADIFAVQDEVTAAIVSTIAPEIGQNEIERVRRRPPGSLDAWALFQQGMALYPSGAANDFQAAIALFDRACLLDPSFVEALVMAGHMRTRYASFFNSSDRDKLLDEARDLLQGAMRLNPSDATCHMAMGRWHVVKREAEIGLEYSREAVELNTNSMLAHFELGIALNGAGQYEEALEHYEIARRLSPKDLHASAMSTGPAFSLFLLGRFEEAAKNAARASRSPNPRYWADALLVASLTRLERKEDADAAKAVLLERKPDFTISEFAIVLNNPDLDIFAALREAGLPE